MNIPVVIVGIVLFLIYLAGTPVVMRHCTRWPAPYWFAIGLSGFAISLLSGSRWRDVAWGIALGTGAAYAIWFSEIGAYHVFRFRQAYTSPWPYLLKAPSYLCIGFIFPICSTGFPACFVRGICAASVYFISYFVIMLGAEFACNIALPRDGTFFWGNYDVFGYRLGIYALSASFISALLVRFTFFRGTSRFRTINK